jgi:hypothetical protein
MSEAQFHLKLLSNYQLVTKPGTYYVSVAYTVREINLIQDEHPRYLIPLRAITTEGLAEIVEMLKTADNGLIPFSELKHVFLAGALWYGEDEVIMNPIYPLKVRKY